MACTHKKGREHYENDPVMLERYDLAMLHVEKAREAGKSAEEIHEMFKLIMEGKGEELCPHMNKNK